MGLCFSYQQRQQLERLSSFFTIEPLYGDCVEDHQFHSELSIGLSKEVNPCEAISTCESKQVQVELVQDSRPTTPPSPTATPEALAREERRRKRDERRAARINSNNNNNTIINNSISNIISDERFAAKSLCEHLDDRCLLNIQTYHPFDEKKKYLVLDIDYTIFDHKSDFDFALEYKRPYLHEFLKTCYAHYNIIIWSATAFYHIQTKMEKLQLLNHADFQICQVLSRDHMIPYAFSIKRKTYIQDIKPLSLLWQKFPEIINPDNTIHIDDVEENFVLNQRNGLRIDPFREALLFRQTDRELFYLAQYLTMIAELPSFESLDHYRWKDYVINTLWSLQTVISLPVFTPPAPPSPELLQQHQQALDLKRALKEKAREDAEKERNAMRMEEQRRTEEIRIESEMNGLRLEHGDGKELQQEWNARLEEELKNLAKAALEDTDRNSRKHKQTSSPRTPQQRTNLSPLLVPQLGQQFTPTQKLTLSPQLGPLNQFNPQKLTLNNLNPQKLTSSPKLTQPTSPQLTITRPPSPFLPHQPRTPTLEISQQHEAKRHKGKEKDGLRQRRSKEETKEEDGAGLADGVRKADWVVTDVQLLDLVRHPTTELILPLHPSPQCARG